ncbi:MAG: 4Fe-4S cluster-binding domain-containing protein [Candidatus ainarchaeum sp.]|nr:4Fe-4S cluster-binding domain-containing protein [Candidatus ainarchaeum sp.]MDD3975893.1 4Fe-4S cluster-binding domain-containing protein [Candidatus ainarchaeum sp.]
MGLYSPKIIKLDNGFAITAEKTLILLNKAEFIKNKSEILKLCEDSFKNVSSSNLQFKSNENTLSFTIIPTTDCNLRCVYCYSDGGFDKKNLTFEFTKEFIDKLIQHNPNCNNINLDFTGGGEPLLNFELIQKVVDYLESKNFNLNISMVTNGILLPKYLPWLKIHSFFLRISYDGCAQKINRPGLNFNSNEKLSETFKLIKNEYPLDLVGVQMTITKSNIDNLPFDVLKIITDYKINSIKIEPVHTSYSIRSKIVNQPTPKEFVDSYLSTLDLLISKNIEVYIDNSYLSIPSTAYFCSIRNKAIISPYNLITSCVEVIKKEGNENNGVVLCDDISLIDFNTIRKIQLDKLYPLHPKNYSDCSECDFVHICKNNCPMRRILNNNHKYKYNCEISHLLIPKFLERANSNKKYLELVFGNSFKERSKCV